VPWGCDGDADVQPDTLIGDWGSTRWDGKDGSCLFPNPLPVVGWHALVDGWPPGETSGDHPAQPFLTPRTVRRQVLHRRRCRRDDRTLIVGVPAASHYEQGDQRDRFEQEHGYQEFHAHDRNTYPLEISVRAWS
jgi:hypothetical protein